MKNMLSGKMALVTGGCGNIGKDIVLLYASEGADIVVVDLEETDGIAFCENVSKDFGVKTWYYSHNMLDIQGHEAFAEKVEHEAGPIDILVNCAGVDNTVTLWDMTETNWDFVMGVNLKGTFFFARAFFKRMMDRRTGRMINLGSISGERGAQFSGPHYSISKAGIIMMTKVFAKLAKDSGVTVNTISPGLIESEMGRSLGLTVNPLDVPMNRFGTTDEVARVALFLASDLSSYMTGQNISVNGGQSMR